MGQRRLAAFAVSALAFNDLRLILAGIRQVGAHHSALRRESRDVEAIGAKVSLAECVRRACATAASSRDEAEEKVDMLTRLKTVFHAGNGEVWALTGAMVDAAIAAEREAWFPAGYVH